MMETFKSLQMEPKSAMQKMTTAMVMLMKDFPHLFGIGF